MKYFVLKQEYGFVDPHFYNEVDVFRRRFRAEDLVFVVDASCIAVCEEHYDYLMYDAEGVDFFETKENEASQG